MKTNRTAQGYGSGFDQLQGLARQGASHRWFKAADRTMDRKAATGSRH